MKLLNAKLVVSAIGIATMTTGPAFAQKSHDHIPQQHRMKSDPVTGKGRGVYNMVPNLDPAPSYNVVPNAYGPGVTGGGSSGYNQMLHDNKW